jgi:hypothetical protein
MIVDLLSVFIPGVVMPTVMAPNRPPDVVSFTLRSETWLLLGTCRARLESGANVIKLFFFATYHWAKEARTFVTGKPFQPNLMFKIKAGAF